MSVKNTINHFIERAKTSNLAKDSFWSVFGNAVSMLLLMICGIIIARVVGKEIYGQYGTVKNLMTSFASLAAFGLGYSTTKLISSDSAKYSGTSIMGTTIVSGISTILFLLFLIFSTQIANFLNKPDFKTFIIYIGILMFLKALFTVGTGVLAGYKKFRRIGLNAIISAFLMLLVCFPLTTLWGLNGALLSLVIYQGSAALLALLYAFKYDNRKMKQGVSEYTYLVKTTLPISIHEMSGTFSSIMIIMIILHYSTYGEYALYSIASQWNAIIIVIPTLLLNLTLSYLSSEQSKNSHKLMLKRMLTINFVSTCFPFALVLLGSGVIANFYGDSFNDLIPTLKVSVLATLLISFSIVFQSNLMSEGRSWYLAIYRLLRDLFSILAIIFAFNYFKTFNHAIIAVSVELTACFIYTLALSVDYSIYKKKDIF